jgi:hypothetical protein
MLHSKKPKFGEVSIDHVTSILTESRVIPLNVPHFLQYSSEITATRALIYALMTGKNNNSINEVQFIAGCNRFGIENPTPTIKKRIALYGNTVDVQRLLNTVRKRVTSTN